ncbi:MAG: carbon storage regulator [Planctomycetota bacterium]
MLALTRRVGEEVVIGDPHAPLGRIRVVDVHGDKVRLAFDFPREVEINRKELADEKLREPPPPETTEDNTDADEEGDGRDPNDDDNEKI